MDASVITSDLICTISSHSAQHNQMVVASLGLRSPAQIRCISHSPSSTPAAAPQDQDANPDAHILFYQDCIPFLTSQLQEGTPPEQAMTLWLDTVETLLQTAPLQADGCLVLNIGSCLETPENARALLSAKFNLQFRNDLPPADPHLPEQDPIWLFLAADMFRRSPKARRLQGKLEALSLLATPQEKQTDPTPNAVFSELKQRAEAAEASNQQHVTVELDLAQLQLSQLKQHAQEQELNHTQAIKAYQSTVAQLQITVQRLQDDMLSSQAVQQHSQKNAAQKQRALKTEADWAKAVTSKTLGEISQLRHEISDRDHRIEEIYASTSWRVTAPMRFIRRLFMQT